jgi:carbon storage regulator
MLIISQRVGDKVVIAGDIQVTVVSVRGGKVRLGVSAPENIRVDRLEVHQRRCAAEQGAQQGELAAAGAHAP